MSGATNCPETPRQKMIGMMYLVLTAMLALNVSTDVLNGFTLVDESMHASIDASRNRNRKLYRSFEEAAKANPEKMQVWYDKAQELELRTDSLCNYLQEFKNGIAAIADSPEAVQAYKDANLDPSRHIEGKSDLDAAAQYAIVEGNAVVLKELLTKYRDYIIDLTEKDTTLRNEFNKIFACSKSWNEHEKDSVDWEIGIFEGMPVGASITILTKIQSDVRTSESEVLQYLLDQTDASDLRVNKLNAYVIPKSDYIIQGGRYSAQIVLAAVDSTQRPEYYVDGQRINDQGIYEVVANSIGVKTFRGQIGYQDPATGEMQYLPFESEYFVSEPSVTISNTDLNIMYRGYDNPFSISVPGVNNNKIKVEVNGASVTQKNGLWIIKPGEQSKTVKVKVLAELEGAMRPMGEREYRVKALPKPGAYFKSGEIEYPEGNIGRAALLNTNATVIASYGPDGLLDLPFQITSFKVRINGMLSEAKGNKFTKDQRDRLGKLKKGADVIITDIKAKGPNGQTVTLAPIPLSLN